jgi:hypothetical protein
VSGDFLHARWDVGLTEGHSCESADRGTRERRLSWFLSLIAYSNGVDESWKAVIVGFAEVVPVCHRASVHRVCVLFAFWYMLVCRLLV